MTGAIAGMAASTGLDPSPVFTNHDFSANLTGQQEVPPVATQATGQAILVQDLLPNQTIPYLVNMTSIQGVTQDHILRAAGGENGPIVVTLFNFDSPQTEVLQNGTIASNNLEGPMQGKQYLTS